MCSDSEVGLYFKAHRLCVSLNSRRESNKEKERRAWLIDPRARLSRRAEFPSISTPVTGVGHAVFRGSLAGRLEPRSAGIMARCGYPGSRLKVMSPPK